MAKKEDKIKKELDSLKRKSDYIVGIDTSLTAENDEVSDIVSKAVNNVISSYGSAVDGKVISYKTDIEFKKMANDILGKIKDLNNTNSKSMNKDDIKSMLTSAASEANELLMQEQDRLLAYKNYKSINEFIPECASALEIIKDNILSPDDFSKTIFNTKYDSVDDDEIKELVDGRLEELKLKYNMEDKADTIITNTLLLGDYYVAVLSLEDELGTMLNDKQFDGRTLNESLRHSDPSYIDSKVTKNDIKSDLSKSDIELLREMYIFDDEEISPKNKSVKSKTLTESKRLDLIDDSMFSHLEQIINENVVIGSKRELLEERALLEKENIYRSNRDTLTDIETINKKRKSKKVDEKPLFINGSSMRMLESEKIVELTVDDICYGYYYVEEMTSSTPGNIYFSASSGRNIQQSANMAGNTVGSSTQVSNPGDTPGSRLGMSDQKLDLISRVFIDNIAKRVDKEFIRKNKQFKDFIYNLVKQNYIVNKGVKMTYFSPDEVVKFSLSPVFEKVLFFSKLYIATLTNDLLVKLGRSHDKRVYYLNVGLDAAYEESINRLIYDIKSKDYRMDNLADVNNILSLAPGRFDDIFIPTINGEKAIDIDVLPGMDSDLRNDFLEWLRQSILSGIGVPQSLIDTKSEVEFARTLSVQNGNLVRRVIREQKKLTPSFTKLMKLLYNNEYRFVNDSENKVENVNIDKIKVSFPSPATLNLTNLTDLINTVDVNAGFIVEQLIEGNTEVMGLADEDKEEYRSYLKSGIAKELLPNIQWDQYETILERKILEKKMAKVKSPKDSDDNMNSFEF